MKANGEWNFEKINLNLTFSNSEFIKPNAHQEIIFLKFKLHDLIAFSSFSFVPYGVFICPILNIKKVGG